MITVEELSAVFKLIHEAEFADYRAEDIKRVRKFASRLMDAGSELDSMCVATARAGMALKRLRLAIKELDE